MSPGVKIDRTTAHKIGGVRANPPLRKLADQQEHTHARSVDALHRPRNHIHDDRFQTLAASYIDQVARMSPVDATGLG